MMHKDRALKSRSFYRSIEILRSASDIFSLAKSQISYGNREAFQWIVRFSIEVWLLDESELDFRTCLEYALNFYSRNYHREWSPQNLAEDFVENRKIPFG